MKPGLVEFLIIYLIQGMHRYDQGLLILILYFFFYKKINLNLTKRYIYINKNFTFVIIVEGKFPFLQGDDLRDAIFVMELVMR